MTTRADHRFGQVARTVCVLVFAFIAAVALGCAPDGGEGGGGTPIASFDQDATAVEPGNAVQFTDTSSGHVTAWSWDFGAAGQSTEQSPLVTFTTPGDYTVRLTVSGASGSSTTEEVDLIHVGALPAAGFSCTPETLVEYVPFEITCTDASSAATSWLWDFGDGSTSTEQSPVHTYTTAGTFTLRQTATNAVGSDSVEMTLTIHALDFTMEFDPPGDEAVPAWVLFTAIDTAGYMSLFSWYVDGVQVGSAPSLWRQFLQPGTYEIQLIGLDLDAPPGVHPSVGSTTKQLVVEFGPPLPEFEADETGGFGPFEVTFNDLSAGAIDQWEWTFGDGASCGWPELPATPPPGMVVCDSASPTHTYESRGRYDVTLTVTGDADAGGTSQTSDTETKAQYITVFIEDAGFEAQTAGGEIGGAWESIYPVQPATTTHVALASASGGSDLAMPTGGSQWAVVEGEGTDGSAPVATIENGIRQSFLHDPARPVLEFDYVLLYAEPPASPVLDATIATVSDGSTTVEITTSAADTDTPYAGPSARYPTRDGSTVRGTPVRVASIDLADAFLGATADTLFTLTIRTSNDQNALRSPLVYVDDVRFVEPRASVTAAFDAGTGPFWTGQPVTFTEQECNTSTTCIAETSWRWDFDTHDLASAPAASGSAEQSPAYTFDERGDYDVMLTVLRGGAEDTSVQTISVYEPVAASLELTMPTDPPLQAPVDLEFADLSVSDVDDPIVAWVWDFGGWGSSSAQDPGPISFLQAGTYTVSLTVTTSLGGTDTATLQVTVE